jgi:hypothetical protein
VGVVETMQNGGNSIDDTAAIYEKCGFLARGYVYICSFLVIVIRKSI